MHHNKRVSLKGKLSTKGISRLLLELWLVTSALGLDERWLSLWTDNMAKQVQRDGTLDGFRW